jgi:hypothetical protein
MNNWKLSPDSALFTAYNTDGSEIRGLVEVTESDSGTMVGDGGFASYSHPKLKFNFTMQLEYRVPLEGGSGTIAGAERMEEIVIPLKTASRPNPTFTTQDVNYYNYRTKVKTSVDPGTVTVVMYDDADGLVHQLHRTYMRAVSPAHRIENIRQLVDNPSAVAFGGMSGICALPNNPNGIIKRLSVYHYYIRNGRWWRTEYMYANPKVQSFEFDELDMTASDVTTLTMTFTHDGVGTEDKPAEIPS